MEELTQSDQNRTEYKELPIKEGLRSKAIVIGYVKVDQEDYDKFCHLVINLFYSPKPYPYIRLEKKKCLLHRLIMNPPEDMVVDHINHDVFDCRKENLRIVTQKINSRNRKINPNNTSGFRNVVKLRNTWQARIFIDGKTKNLGTFKEVQDANQLASNARAVEGYLDQGITPIIVPIEHKKLKHLSISNERYINWDPLLNKWRVRIHIPGTKKPVSAGCFTNLADAIIARDIKLKELGLELMPNNDIRIPKRKK